MTHLIDAYTRWSNEPCPPGSSRDDIDLLHAELATVDLWLADMVIPYVESGKRFPLKVDISEALRHLSGGVCRLRESAQRQDLSLLDRYALYVDLMEGVFRAYEAELRF